MGIDLQQFSDSKKATEEFEKIFPRGTPRAIVEKTVGQLGTRYYDRRTHLLSYRYVMPSVTMVHVVWSIAFYFDSNELLNRIVVGRGLSGP